MKNEKRKLNIGCVWELPTGMGEREGMRKVYMYVYTFLQCVSHQITPKKTLPFYFETA